MITLHKAAVMIPRRLVTSPLANRSSIPHISPPKARDLRSFVSPFQIWRAAFSSSKSFAQRPEHGRETRPQYEQLVVHLQRNLEDFLNNHHAALLDHFGQCRVAGLSLLDTRIQMFRAVWVAYSAPITLCSLHFSIVSTVGLALILNDLGVWTFKDEWRYEAKQLMGRLESEKHQKKEKEPTNGAMQRCDGT